MNRFNLLDDPWIPVRTVDGKELFISAYEISRKDILSLNAPRADFNAALFQLLIGLVQTILTSETNRKWRDRYCQPPSEQELKGSFNLIKKAFYLDGDGTRFMQDQSLKSFGKRLSIEELIFGAPGGSGKEKNTDFFIKKSDIDSLCYSCAASALVTANIFAEDGGSGYFQSMTQLSGKEIHIALPSNSGV